ncbi:hypothetical protein L9F63_007066, partial [Diploptera punctata]
MFISFFHIKHPFLFNFQEYWIIELHRVLVLLINKFLGLLNPQEYTVRLTLYHCEVSIYALLLILHRTWVTSVMKMEEVLKENSMQIRQFYLNLM